MFTINYILQNENNVGELYRLKDSLKEYVRVSDDFLWYYS